MSKLVAPSEIEGIVGAKRHQTDHIGRAVSETETVYILHSQECLDSGIDLRDCPYSLAMDDCGIDTGGTWSGQEDRPVVLHIIDGALHPARAQRQEDEA